MLSIPGFLAACSDIPFDAPSRIELANIKPANVVPKSSPEQLIDAFDDVCFADSVSDAEAKLRAAGYVPATRVASSTMTLYYVDDERPAVGLRAAVGGFDCAVHAETRTGQTNAVDDYVARKFPKAELRDNPHTERYWLAPYTKGGILFTSREGRPWRPETYIVGILRPQARLNSGFQAAAK
jgi:hypothetical protein